jgi:hypothetical protein
MTSSPSKPKISSANIVPQKESSSSSPFSAIGTSPQIRADRLPERSDGRLRREALFPGEQAWRRHVS